MHRFKAYRTFEDDKVVSSRFVEMTEDDLDPGDVIVRTKYSTINYKDALSYNGAGRIMRKFPTVGGIDMAGTVEGSADPRFKRGDKVIVHAIGTPRDGQFVPDRLAQLHRTVGTVYAEQLHTTQDERHDRGIELRPGG